MRRAGVTLLGLAVASCSLAALDGYSSSSGGAAPPDGGPDTAAPTAPLPDAGADAATGTDAGSTAKSCKEIQATTPTATDGYYPSTYGELYCDMTSDGGGWTLVARSAGATPVGSFGWSKIAGAARDDAQPYSLGVLGLDVPFTEVLVGSRGDGKKWLTTWRVQLPRVRLVVAGGSDIVLDERKAIRGACTDEDTPDMIYRAGYTDLDDHFHFRDVPGAEDEGGGVYGLFSSKFELRYADCKQGGLLDQRPGMIFVR